MAAKLPAVRLLTSVVTQVPAMLASRRTDVPGLVRAVLSGMGACRGTAPEAHEALVGCLVALLRAWAHCRPWVTRVAQGGPAPYSQVGGWLAGMCCSGLVAL
jgi:hypothetical protein